MGKDSKESKDIEKVQVEIQVRSVPDGGWGWLVCLAGFIAQFVVLGIQNNTGILYKALLEEFRQSKGETGINLEFISIYDFMQGNRSLFYLVEHDFERALFRLKCQPVLLNQATDFWFIYPNKQSRAILRSIPPFKRYIREFKIQFLGEYSNSPKLYHIRLRERDKNFFGSDREITGCAKLANKFDASNQQRQSNIMSSTSCRTKVKQSVIASVRKEEYAISAYTVVAIERNFV